MMLSGQHFDEASKVSFLNITNKTMAEDIKFHINKRYNSFSRNSKSLRGIVNSFHDSQKSSMKYCHMRCEIIHIIWLVIWMIMCYGFQHLRFIFFTNFLFNYLKDNAEIDPRGRLGQVFIFMEEKLLWKFHSRNVGWFKEFQSDTSFEPCVFWFQVYEALAFDLKVTS